MTHSRYILYIEFDKRNAILFNTNKIKFTMLFFFSSISYPIQFVTNLFYRNLLNKYRSNTSNQRKLGRKQTVVCAKITTLENVISNNFFYVITIELQQYR